MIKKITSKVVFVHNFILQCIFEIFTDISVFVTICAGVVGLYKTNSFSDPLIYIPVILCFVITFLASIRVFK